MKRLTLTSTLLLSVATQASPKLGVVNKLDGDVSIIDLVSGQAERVKVGHLPHEITTAGPYFAVTNYGHMHIRSSSLVNDPGRQLTLIRATAPFDKVEIDLGNRCGPHGIVASQSGDRVYVTCEIRQEILAVDVARAQVLYSVPTNQVGSHMLAVSSDERLAYVANFWVGTVSVLDLNSRKILKQLSVGRGVEGIGLSPDDKTLYVTLVESDRILKIDTASFEITGQVDTPAKHSPIRALLSSDGKHLLVPNSGAGVVNVYDPQTLALRKSIPVGKQPIGFVVPNSKLAFAANMKDNSVSMINLETLEVDATFPTGREPDGVAYIE